MDFLIFILKIAIYINPWICTSS